MTPTPQKLLFDDFSLMTHRTFHLSHQLQQLIKCRLEGLLSQPIRSLGANLYQPGCPGVPTSPIMAPANYILPFGSGMTLAKVREH